MAVLRPSRFLPAVLLPLIGSLPASIVIATSGETVSPLKSGTATLIVEQDTRDRMFGKWSLIAQGGTAREGVLQTETADHLLAGNYSFLVDPPDGAVSTLRLLRGGELVKGVDRQQMSFTIAAGETLRMVIRHHFTHVGTVTVETNPPGVPFTFFGPNSLRHEGASPMSWLNMPEGQYKVQFEALEGCVKPAPQSLFLERDKRISFSLTLVCDEANRMRAEQESSREQRFVTVTIDGEDVTFEDVPQEAWFAPHVFDVARRGVLSGYRDDRGRPTGRFGPDNNVTVAELAKIAHSIIGIGAEDITDAPDNVRAQNAWFSGFIASAEERGWTIYADASVDPLRDATRGEVLVTLLQALDLRLQWQKGNVFADVSVRTPYAAAIETAAGAKIVSGRKDTTGKDTHLFGPMDAINRAELAKMLDAVIDLKLVPASSAQDS